MKLPNTVSLVAISAILIAVQYFLGTADLTGYETWVAIALPVVGTLLKAVQEAIEAKKTVRDATYPAGAPLPAGAPAPAPRSGVVRNVLIG